MMFTTRIVSRASLLRPVLPSLFPIATTFRRTAINTYKHPETSEFLLKTPELEKLSYDELIENHLEKHMPEERLTGVSGEWATALYSYGGLQKCRDTLESDLRKISSDPSIRSFYETITDRASTFDINTDLINQFLKENTSIHPQTALLLKKLLQLDLLWLLPRILDKFFSVMNILNNVKEGVIFSAKPMSDKELADTIEYVQRVYYQNSIRLRAELRVDPSLIEGWEARIEQSTFGYTHQKKIKQLKAMFKREVHDLNAAMEKALSRM